MAKPTSTQRRVELVLNRMYKMVLEEPSMARALAPGLQQMLDDIHIDDGFGTEGQNDPRGDFRNGLWSMRRVEGVDK